MSAFGDYERLLDRVDAHATRVHREHAAAFACAPGCSGCCHRQLSVFPVEAARIEAWVSENGLAEDAAGEAHVHPLTVLEDSQPCALLDPAGRCRIYPVRPIICRTHGLPLAVPDGEGLRGDVCPLNFAEVGLSGLQSTDFLSLSPVNAVLVAINAAFVQRHGVPPARVELADLAAVAP